jgi:cob(I)alamin adenosyltransferase
VKGDREVLDEVLELTRDMYRLSTKDGIAHSLESWINRLQDYYYYVDRQATGSGAAERIDREVTALESALKTIREAQWHS